MEHDTAATKLCAIALLDVSASVPDEALDKALPELQALFANLDADHGAGLVAFAGSPRVLVEPRFEPLDALELRKRVFAIRKPDNPHAAGALDLERTHVERALDLALGLFPAGYSRRLVLFSDGRANAGRAQEKILAARARGVDLHAVTLSHAKAPFDLAVASLSVPTQTQEGVGYEVKVDVVAQAAAVGRVKLFRNGFLVERRELELQAGHNELRFRQQTEEPGQYVYRAQLECDRRQASLDNDAGYAFTRLRSKKKKLLVLGELESEAFELLTALQQSRCVPEFRTPDGAPEQLLDLLDYDGVILNNLLAASLPTDRQVLLRDWVDLFGGGLLSIGLDSLGGYEGTPIEEALPVSAGKERLPKPSLSIVMLADTSSSIVLADRADAAEAGGESGAFSRPEIMRNAAKLIVDSLSERDTFGLIGFGTEKYAPRWLVSLQKAYDKQMLKERVESQLQTTPYVLDGQRLHELLQARLEPAELGAAAQVAADLTKALRENQRPHLTVEALSDYARKTLKMQAKAVNMLAVANEAEGLIQPNAFLARSNAYPALQRAVNALKQMESVDKRIVLLSDGYVEGNVDYRRLAGRLAADGIKVSTVALKEGDAYKKFLDEVAHWGMGRGYRVEDPGAFAGAFKADVEAQGNPRVLEQPFRPRKIADAPHLRGVNVSLAPQLFGYVRTAPKLGARTLLGVPPDYEPLLAAWDYGSGRSAVFTADAQERWASLWLRNWKDGYRQLWESTVHALCARSAARVLRPQVDVHGQQVALEVDFLDGQNRFLNGEPLHVRFYYLGESGYLFSRTAAEEAPLRQVAPGRYVCDYAAAKKGLYLARIGGPRAGDLSCVGFVISTVAEQTERTEDAETLARWAQTGGGSLDSEPKVWLDLGGKRHLKRTDLSAWAALLAVLVFTLDVVLRRWPAYAAALRGKTGKADA
ncbi:MAG: VWA domain-containing protein [Planctomycetota bacterium]|nr:VWA domain-containing protein [Planctomycetota bacterium]